MPRGRAGTPSDKLAPDPGLAVIGLATRLMLTATQRVHFIARKRNFGNATKQAREHKARVN